mmetsp:Transcript_3393/g.4953  ORF Transcript_3393/g.4953 Transcript_3393/m.4953 type:complete len:87 (-) Transcript_3393:24-284(-)
MKESGNTCEELAFNTDHVSAACLPEVEYLLFKKAYAKRMKTVVTCQIYARVQGHLINFMLAKVLHLFCQLHSNGSQSSTVWHGTFG